MPDSMLLWVIESILSVTWECTPVKIRVPIMNIQKLTIYASKIDGRKLSVGFDGKGLGGSGWMILLRNLYENMSSNRFWILFRSE